MVVVVGVYWMAGVFFREAAARAKWYWTFGKIRNLLSAAASREACLQLAAQLSFSLEPFFENNFNELRNVFNLNNSRESFKTKQRADEMSHQSANRNFIYKTPEINFHD